MSRFYEIDFIKGIAVIFMIIFHYFLIINLKYNKFSISNNLNIIATISHFIFIFFMGTNLYNSYIKNKYKKNKFYKKQIFRSILLLSFGFIITFITKILLPDKYVIFGILHFLSISNLLAIPFLHSIYHNIIGIIIFYILNIIISFQKCNFNKLLCFILGFPNYYYNSIDHFSLIPHFLIILFGILYGNIFYKKQKQSKISNYLYKNSIIFKFISHLGKYSLQIYLLHWFFINLIT